MDSYIQADPLKVSRQKYLPYKKSYIFGIKLCEMFVISGIFVYNYQFVLPRSYQQVIN